MHNPLPGQTVRHIDDVTCPFGGKAYIVIRSTVEGFDFGYLVKDPLKPDQKPIFMYPQEISLTSANVNFQTEDEYRKKHKWLDIIKAILGAIIFFGHIPFIKIITEIINKT